MEGVVTFAVCVLASIFVGSFISLVLLCRHNSVRKKTIRNLRKYSLSGSWGNEADMVMVGGLGGRCLKLLGLCRNLDFPHGNLTVAHIDTLKHIVEMARSITEDSEAGEKAGLLQPHTTTLVLQASKTLAEMEQKLVALKEEIPFEDLGQVCSISYKPTILI